MSYKHLSLEERERLVVGLALGLTLRDIGKGLGRHHTTLGRELERNSPFFEEYLPCKAERRARRRALKQRYKAPLKEAAIYLYVREHLRMGWSPETIAGRLAIDQKGKHLTKETIYSYVYHRRNKREKLWKYLTLKRKKRMKKMGRSVQRLGKIKGAVSIDLRPKEVSLRKVLGHWETDNLEGKRSDKTALSVTVERLTRLVLLGKLGNRLASSKTDGLIERLAQFPPQARLTLTADNGSENSYHQKITQALSLPVFFCHAYHSWEKGTVENTNGRIRNYIRKGESLDGISESQIAVLENRFNNTPRKCLNFLTPYEKMTQILSS